MTKGKRRRFWEREGLVPSPKAVDLIPPGVDLTDLTPAQMLALLKAAEHKEMTVNEIGEESITQSESFKALTEALKSLSTPMGKVSGAMMSSIESFSKTMKAEKESFYDAKVYGKSPIASRPLGKVFKRSADDGTVEVRLSGWPLSNDDSKWGYSSPADDDETIYRHAIKGLTSALGWVYINDSTAASALGGKGDSVLEYNNYFYHQPSETYSNVNDNQVFHLFPIGNTDWLQGLIRFLGFSEDFIYYDPIQSLKVDYSPYEFTASREMLEDPKLYPKIVHRRLGLDITTHRNVLDLVGCLTSWCIQDRSFNPEPGWLMSQPFYCKGLIDMKGEPLSQDHICSCSLEKEWSNCNHIQLSYFSR